MEDWKIGLACLAFVGVAGWMIKTLRKPSNVNVNVTGRAKPLNGSPSHLNKGATRRSSARDSSSRRSNQSHLSSNCWPDDQLNDWRESPSCNSSSVGGGYSSSSSGGSCSSSSSSSSDSGSSSSCSGGSD